MHCKYEFVLQTICPVDGANDTYHATIESTELIFVERMLNFAKETFGKKITQEHLTTELALRFPLCKVTTIGYHSGVRTTVTI